MILTALTPVLNTVLHRFTSTLVPQLNPLNASPYTLVALLYATHTDSPSRVCPSLSVYWTYMMLSKFLDFCTVFQ